MKGVFIPIDIIKDDNLSIQEKIIVSMVKNMPDGLYMTNASLASLLGVSKGRVSHIVTEINKKGYINVRLIYGENKQVEKRIITLKNGVFKKKYTPYKDYLQSEHWKETRKKALDRSGHKCQLCGEKQGLNVHHNNYDCLYEETSKDLVVLCKCCHSKFHDK